MAEVIKMPRLSDTMEEGVVATWLKKVGEFGLEQTLEEYTKSKHINTIEVTNDQYQRNQWDEQIVRINSNKYSIAQTRQKETMRIDWSTINLWPSRFFLQPPQERLKMLPTSSKSYCQVQVLVKKYFIILNQHLRRKVATPTVFPQLNGINDLGQIFPTLFRYSEQ